MAGEKYEITVQILFDLRTFFLFQALKYELLLNYTSLVSASFYPSSKTNKCSHKHDTRSSFYHG
jgi:hypothetical protein